MADFEEWFIYLHKLFNKHAKIWWRFIDDVFCIWEGPLQSLLTFFEFVNSVWTKLKFTITYGQFLDTLVQKNDDGTINTDISRKTTDQNSILHFASGNPNSLKKVIPKSQFQKVCRIVSDTLITGDGRKV